MIYLNLLYYAALTLHDFKNDNKKQTTVAYTSAIITCILFIVVILHHAIQLVKNRIKARRSRTRAGQADITQTNEVVITFSVMEISDSQVPTPELQLHAVNPLTQDDEVHGGYSSHSPHESINSEDEQESY